MLSADITVVPSVHRKMNNKSSKCAAFSISNHIFMQINRSEPDHRFKYIRLQQGISYNNYAYVVHPAITVTHAVKIRNFFLDPKIQTLLQPIYRQTAVKTNLVRTRKFDYPLEYTKQLNNYWQNPLPGKPTVITP